MPIRGEIVIECDTPTCHAELVVGADRAWGLEYEVDEAGWQVRNHQRFICPECRQEGKADGKP